MTKKSIQEKNILLINTCAPNIREPKYVKQILTDIQGETDGNTVKVEDFNAPLTSMDRFSRQKIKTQ